MRKLLVISLAMVMVLAFTGMVGAVNDTATQDIQLTIDQIAQLKLAPLGPGSMELIIDSASAGAKPDDSAANILTNLQYTSVVSDNDADPATPTTMARTITVEADVIPDGTKLAITASGLDAANNEGAAAGTIDLTDDAVGAQDLITGIQSTATGDGVDDGPQVTYTFQVKSEAEVIDLLAQTTDVQLTYTLTDES